MSVKSNVAERIPCYFQRKIEFTKTKKEKDTKSEMNITEFWSRLLHTHIEREKPTGERKVLENLVQSLIIL